MIVGQLTIISFSRSYAVKLSLNEWIEDKLLPNLMYVRRPLRPKQAHCMQDKKVFLMTLYASVGNARLQLMKNAKAST